MEKKWHDQYEPNEEEIKEIEELLQKMEEEEEEEDEQEDVMSNALSKRIYYHYESFTIFKNWLSKNGIRW